jgi:hypothetical protein
MQQVDGAAAQHPLSPFSSPFFGVKLLYDYGLCSADCPPPPQTTENIYHYPFLHLNCLGRRVSKRDAGQLFFLLPILKGWLVLCRLIINCSVHFHTFTVLQLPSSDTHTHRAPETDNGKDTHSRCSLSSISRCILFAQSPVSPIP